MMLLLTASTWSDPNAVADALAKISTLAGGFLIGVGVLAAWYVWCRWGRRPKGP